MKYKFKTTPYKHQVRALKKLLRNNGGALFMPMRSGKTKTAIDWAAATNMKDPSMQKVLVVCPKNVIPVWYREIKTHCPHVGVMWRVINFERLYDRERNGRSWVAVDNKELYDFSPDAIIIDEAHRIGDPTTLQSKKAYKLQKQLGVKYKLIMTGTPMHRKVFMAFGQFKFLDDSIFGTNWGAFKRQFGVFGGYGGHVLLKYVNLNLFRKKIEPITFSMAHVPPRPPIHQVIPVALDASARSYREMAMESMIDTKGGSVEAPLIVTRVIKLKQLACGYIRDEDRNVHRIGTEMRDAAQAFLEEMLDNEIQKVVVCCNEIPQLKDAARAAKEAGYKVVLAHGGVKDLETRIDKFQTKAGPIAFVCIATKVREGIDLSAAQDMVFYDIPRSLVTYDQVTARIRKFKDRRPLTYYYLIPQGTVYEANYLAMNQGLDLVDLIMKHPDLLSYREVG